MVCPPKNSMTNLNYDLENLANMTLDNKTRNDLAKFAIQQVADFHYEDIIKQMRFFLEENKYYNWYHGFSEVDLLR